MAALNDEAHALKMMVKLLTTLTESLGKVEENLSLVAEFYKSDLSAPTPSKKMRLENVVNTHRNGIDKILVKLAKSLKTVHWSKYPRPEMKKCCDAVETLFTALSDITATSPLFADGQLGDTDNAVAAFCSFLTCGVADCDPSAIPPKIDAHLKEMRRHFDIDKHLFYLLTREIIAMRETANNQVSEEKCLDSTGNETSQNNGELAHQQNRGRRNRYPKAVEDEIWDWASRPCYELDRERNGVPCRDLKKAASEWALLSHSRDSPKTSYEFMAAFKQIQRRHRQST